MNKMMITYWNDLFTLCQLFTSTYHQLCLHNDGLVKIILYTDFAIFWTIMNISYQY